MITVSISSFVTGVGLAFAPARYEKFEVRTSRHGDSSLNIVAVENESIALSLLGTKDNRKIVVCSDGVPIWFGVVADVLVDGKVVDITAFGRWSFLKSTLVSEIWSHTIPQEWAVLAPIHTSYSNERYSVDNDGRLYIGLKKNEEYHDTVRGNWYFEKPYGSSGFIETFSFSYDVTLPSGYTAEVRSAFHDNSSQVVEWQVNGNGSQQTGSANLTSLTNGSRLIFLIYKTGTTPTAYTSDTDEFYAYIDALRIKGTSSATVDSSEIVESVYSAAVSQNPLVFRQGIYVPSAGHDFQDVLYTDTPAANIISSIEDAGSTSSERLAFNIDRYGNASLLPDSESGRVWYADIQGLSVATSLDGYSNYVYTRYKDSNDLVRRTAYASTGNDLSPGIVIADFLDYRTTSDSEAQAVRDAYLDAVPLRAVKAKIAIINMRPAHSDVIGLEFVRGGDKLIINALPYTFQSPDRTVYYFDIIDTTYDAVNDTLQLSIGLGGDDQKDAIIEALTGEFDYIEL